MNTRTITKLQKPKNRKKLVEQIRKMVFTTALAASLLVGSKDVVQAEEATTIIESQMEIENQAAELEVTATKIDISLIDLSAYQGNSLKEGLTMAGLDPSIASEIANFYGISYDGSEQTDKAILDILRSNAIDLSAYCGVSLEEGLTMCGYIPTPALLNKISNRYGYLKYTGDPRQSFNLVAALKIPTFNLGGYTGSNLVEGFTQYNITCDPDFLDIVSREFDYSCYDPNSIEQNARLVEILSVHSYDFSGYTGNDLIEALKMHNLPTDFNFRNGIAYMLGIEYCQDGDPNQIYQNQYILDCLRHLILADQKDSDKTKGMNEGGSNPGAAGGGAVGGGGGGEGHKHTGAKPEHEHQYTETIEYYQIDDNTHKKTIRKKCTCGEESAYSETENHNYKEVSTAYTDLDDKTHLKVTTYKCQCGRSKTITEELEHVYTEWKFNPDTKMDERVCIHDGHKDTRTHTHDPNLDKVVSWDENGESFACKEPLCTGTVTIEGHNLIFIGYNPTTNENEYECSHKDIGCEYIDSRDHNCAPTAVSIQIIGTENLCTIETTNCSTCGKIISQQVNTAHNRTNPPIFVTETPRSICYQCGDCGRQYWVSKADIKKYNLSEQQVEEIVMIAASTYELENEITNLINIDDIRSINFDKSENNLEDRWAQVNTFSSLIKTKREQLEAMKNDPKYVAALNDIESALSELNKYEELVKEERYELIILENKNNNQNQGQTESNENDNQTAGSESDSDNNETEETEEDNLNNNQNQGQTESNENDNQATGSESDNNETEETEEDNLNNDQNQGQTESNENDNQTAGSESDSDNNETEETEEDKNLAREKAEKEAQEKAEKEAQEKAEKEAQEKAEKEAQEEKEYEVAFADMNMDNMTVKYTTFKKSNNLTIDKTTENDKINTRRAELEIEKHNLEKARQQRVFFEEEMVASIEDQGSARKLTV